MSAATNGNNWFPRSSLQSRLFWQSRANFEEQLRCCHNLNKLLKTTQENAGTGKSKAINGSKFSAARLSRNHKGKEGGISRGGMAARNVCLRALQTWKSLRSQYPTHCYE